MTLADLLAAAATLGLERLDAQLLLLHALGRAQTDRAWLLAHDTDPVDPVPRQHFAHLCARRATAEPVAYILGHKEFFGLDLRVDKRVLVPRPETETLVEWALELISDQACRVIDLGTGSGAIALAIKKGRPAAFVEAVDTSGEALDVARANAQLLGLDVRFSQASWLSGATGPYDVIVSNPPYVAARDPHLVDLAHEPIRALAAGDDGLADIRIIVAQARAHLRPGGRLLLEHGYDQAAAVRGLLTAAGLDGAISRRDLSGIERCSGGKRPEQG